MAIDDEKPFVEVAGDGSVYKFTWVNNQVGDRLVKYIGEGDPRYWIFAHVLDSVCDDMDLESFANGIEYQLGEVRRIVAQEKKSYTVNVRSLSREGMKKLEALLGDLDYNYEVHEEEK